MKGINFVKTIAPKEQRRIKNWYRFSVGIFSIAGIAVVFLHSYQWHTLSKLQTQYVKLQSSTAEYKQSESRLVNSKKQEKELVERTRVVHDIKNRQQQFVAKLSKLQSSLPCGVVQSYDLSNNLLELVVSCTTSLDAVSHVQRLNDGKTFIDCYVAALSKTDLIGNALTARIKGRCG